MPQLPEHTDILVVGAGPTGLALAADLQRRGLSPLVVDKIAEGANTSRAAVVHARTLEVLEPLGVVPTILAEGLEVPVFRVRDRDKTLAEVDFTDIPSPYNYTLMFPQNRTEAVLLERLQALGGSVTRPVDVTDVRQGAESVAVDVAHEGGHQTIEARWVVACDGMHSRVREAAGIGFAGEPYQQGFALADVRMDWPLTRGEVSLFLSPDGLVVVAPLPNDHFRIVATDDNAPQTPTIDYMQMILDTRGPQTRRGKVHGIAWASRFHVHHRIAETPRKGRILLCGDAAHVHSPAGGQGMNTGIQDAISLAGALADVLGGAPEQRLDEWAASRHKVAEGVVGFTDRMTRMATLSSPLAIAARNAMISVLSHVPQFSARMARQISEIDNR